MVHRQSPVLDRVPLRDHTAQRQVQQLLGYSHLYPPRFCRRPPWHSIRRCEDSMLHHVIGHLYFCGHKL